MSGAIIRELKAGDAAFTLTFKFGTLRQAEQALGSNVLTALNEGLSLDAISAILWAVLQPAHPMSRERADELVDEAGVPAVVEAVAAGLAAFLNTGAAAGGGAEGNARRTKPSPKR